MRKYGNSSAIHGLHGLYLRCAGQRIEGSRRSSWRQTFVILLRRSRSYLEVFFFRNWTQKGHLERGPYMPLADIIEGNSVSSLGANPLSSLGVASPFGNMLTAFHTSREHSRAFSTIPESTRRIAFQFSQGPSTILCKPICRRGVLYAWTCSMSGSIPGPS